MCKKIFRVELQLSSCWQKSQFFKKSAQISHIHKKQNKTKQKQNKTKQNKTKQNKTKQNRTKQNKTKQNKTKNT